jgi:DNA-binding MarR family transcriptional regulator
VTPRQRDYLSALNRELARLGYSPTLAEVAAAVEVTPQRAADVVTSLERQGLVRRDYATARSLRITDAGRAALAEGQAA